MPGCSARSVAARVVWLRYIERECRERRRSIYYAANSRQHTACDMIRRCSIPYAAKSKALQCGVPKHLAKLLKGNDPDLQLVAANALMRSKPHYCSHAHLCHYRLVGPSAVQFVSASSAERSLHHD